MFYCIKFGEFSLTKFQARKTFVNRYADPAKKQKILCNFQAWAKFVLNIHSFLLIFDVILQ